MLLKILPLFVLFALWFGSVFCEDTSRVSVFQRATIETDPDSNLDSSESLKRLASKKDLESADLSMSASDKPEKINQNAPEGIKTRYKLYGSAPVYRQVQKPQQEAEADLLLPSKKLFKKPEPNSEDDLPLDKEGRGSVFDEKFSAVTKGKDYRKMDTIFVEGLRDSYISFSFNYLIFPSIKGAVDGSLSKAFPSPFEGFGLSVGYGHRPSLLQRFISSNLRLEYNFEILSSRLKYKPNESNSSEKGRSDIRKTFTMILPTVRTIYDINRMDNLSYFVGGELGFGWASYTNKFAGGSQSARNLIPTFSVLTGFSTKINNNTVFDCSYRYLMSLSGLSLSADYGSTTRASNWPSKETVKFGTHMLQFGIRRMFF